MRDGLIHDLIYGTLQPYEDMSTIQSAEYRRVEQNYRDCRKLLEQALNDGQKPKLSELLDLKTALCSLSEEQSMIYSFCLGAQLAMEIMAGF